MHIDENDRLAAALAYARMGLAIYPVSRKKHPLIKGWNHGMASKDPDQLSAWWNQWRNANVGIACGGSSGLIVIDVDVHPDRGIRGDITLNQWQQEHGSFPVTATSRTGSGGMHLYFQYPGHTMEYANDVGLLSGLDLRTDGGGVVAPPSIHENGVRYTWLNGLDPMTVGIAHVNDSVIELLNLARKAEIEEGTFVEDEDLGADECEGRTTAGGVNAKEFTPPDMQNVEEGQRNDAVYQCARMMSVYRVPKDIAMDALQAINRRFPQPLDSGEVRTTVDSAYNHVRAISLRAVWKKGSKADDFVKNYKEISEPWGV